MNLTLINKMETWNQTFFPISVLRNLRTIDILHGKKMNHDSIHNLLGS